VALSLYGLDIETDTTADGLDPGIAAVVAVAVSAHDGDVVLTGDEAGILSALDATMASLAPGIIVTWNGGAFDLPFLASRAVRAGVELGLELVWDPGAYRPPGRLPLPDRLGTYGASWYHHRHVDAYRAWRNIAGPDESCALKAVARSHGIEPVDTIDASRIHELDLARLRRYVADDASLARRLAKLKWSQVRGSIDRLPTSGQLAFG